MRNLFKNEKLKFYFLWFGQFIIVVYVWVAMNLFLGIWSFSETIKIHIGIGANLWLGTFMPIAFYILYKHIKDVETYRVTRKQEDLGKAQKRAASLSKWYLIMATIKATIGPNFAILEHSFFFNGFIDPIEYFLDILFSIALLLIFWPPFDLALSSLWERWTADIPLSKKYRAFSLKARIFKVCFLMFLGAGIGMILVGVAAYHNYDNFSDAFLFFFEKGLIFYLFIYLYLGYFFSNIFRKIGDTRCK